MERVLIDLRLLPRWELISELRRLVNQGLERLHVDEEQAFGASLATHELLENAVKYGQGEVRVRIVLNKAERTLRRVDVENRTTRAHIVKLKRIVSEVAQAADPMHVYTQKMRAASPGTSAGLGLARIAAETGMSLKCSVRANRVAVSAALNARGHD